MKYDVVVVGCGPAGSVTARFAAETGASVVYPSEDLRLEEKREMTVDFKFKNKHERDALVSAMVAYNALKKVLRKIDRILMEEDKRELKDKVRELVLKRKINGIKNAIRFLEHG